MLAPERLPRDRRTEETVTVRPMSRSRPVPLFSAPNLGVAYHWLYQGRPACPAIANAAFCGLSPSARPAGPNAATLAGARACTATGVTEGGGEMGAWDALAVLVPVWAELPWTAGALAGGWVGPPAGEGPRPEIGRAH